MFHLIPNNHDQSGLVRTNHLGFQHQSDLPICSNVARQHEYTSNKTLKWKELLSSPQIYSLPALTHANDTNYDSDSSFSSTVHNENLEIPFIGLIPPFKPLSSSDKNCFLWMMMMMIYLTVN
eukprot:1388_1